MIYLYVFGGIIACLLLAWAAVPNPPRKFPKGHIHEYDPTGQYTYKHLNPIFKEQ